MSVEVGSTPMSIDRSVMLDENIQKSLAIKNDRDRFFEVTEYQNDILKYLKIVEVKNQFFFLNLTLMFFYYRTKGIFDLVQII